MTKIPTSNLVFAATMVAEAKIPVLLTEKELLDQKSNIGNESGMVELVGVEVEALVGEA